MSGKACTGEGGMTPPVRSELVIKRIFVDFWSMTSWFLIGNIILSDY